MYLRGIIYILFIPFIFLSPPANAGEVDEHAPIGVMGDHIHKKGEWMVSYRYMRMDMPQNYTGSKKLDVGEVHNDYMISPIEMTMEMHMIGIMYGLNDELTANVMFPYVRKVMNHRRRTDSATFKTETKGLGDVRLGGMYSLKQHVDQPVHINFGISLPSGSIDEHDDTLARVHDDLPYPMQLGSGTFDLLPGFTYLDKKGEWSWGLQSLSTLRLGKNEFKYRLGHNYETDLWGAYKWNNNISTSLRLKSSIWGNINGADQRLNPAMVPTADSNRRAGEQLDLFVGFNLLKHDKHHNGHRLALEFGYPVYRHLQGPQLGVDLQGTLGWQKAW